jgi:hypothetical protein
LRDSGDIYPTQEGCNPREQATLQVSDIGSGGRQDVPPAGQGTVIELTPSHLAFGKERVGYTSEPPIVTPTNTASQPLSNIGISFEGQDATEFTENDNCKNGVPGGGQCKIRVRFAPISKGSKKANLQVSCGSDSARPVPLRGSGT